MFDFQRIGLLKSEFITKQVVNVIPMSAFANSLFQRSIWLMYAHVDTRSVLSIFPTKPLHPA